MRPDWIKSKNQFEKFIFESHQRAINDITTEDALGSNIHIAIVDSVQKIPNKSDFYGSVGFERGDYLDVDENYTCLHGVRVCKICAYFAPRAKYSFYQVIKESGKVPIGALEDAITDILEDNVDIVNLSAGQEWDHDTAVNPYSLQASRLIENGIPIVAAAGNHDEPGLRPKVYCPAAMTDIVAVSSLVADCPCEIEEIHDVPFEGPYYAQSPTEPSNPGFESGAFCSYESCPVADSCISAQTERPWTGNPAPRDDKPDILAPMFYPSEIKEGYELLSGTSFSAPIVTGTLARSMSTLSEIGSEMLEPQTIRSAIINSGSRIDRGDTDKINAFRLRTQLEDLTIQTDST